MNHNYNFDIEADWNLDLYCNFNCIYCISRSNRLPIIQQEHISRIKFFFDSTKIIWHMHFTGGEPFLYPDFLDLCYYFSSKHYMSVNTNLSSDLIQEFCEKINPAKVLFINAGLHIEERERLGLVKDFIDKVQCLQSKKFRVFVSYVMLPSLLNRFKSDFDFFQSHGIIIYPKLLRSRYQGKVYPDSYTESEKRMLRKFFDIVSVFVEKKDNNVSDFPLIDLSLDQKFIDGIPSFQGKLCLAGSRFVRVWNNGDITRCDKGGKIIGNVYLGDLQLMNKAEVCNTYSCPYFCVKYTNMALQI